MNQLFAKIPRSAVFIAGAVIALFALYLIVDGITAGSAPGDSLYPMKKTIEKYREKTVFTRYGQAMFALSMSERRIDEAQVLLSRGNKTEARKLLIEHRDLIEEALASSEFLLEQKQVDRIVDRSESIRARGDKLRAKTTPSA